MRQYELKQVTRDEWFHAFSSPWARWRAFGFRESLSAWWECGRLRYWFSLPWRCKFRHKPVEQRAYECDGMYLSERWLDCARCHNYLRRLERDEVHRYEVQR